MGLIHSPSIVTDGLIACFDPANPRGRESSSALINFAQVPDKKSLAIFNGTSFDDDRNGGVMSFDGTNDSAVFNNYDALNAVTSSVSLSAWFYLNGLPAGETALIRKNNQWALQMLSSTSIRCLVRTDGSTGWTSANDVVFNFVTGKWYNMAVTWDGSYMRIYMDAVLIKSGNVTGALDTNSNQVAVGYHSSNYLNGYMGIVLINSIGLTGDEVRRNYEATKGRYQ